MKFLNFIFIIIFALSTNIGYAAKITDDTLTVAKPGSSANKELKLGTKVIRSNESTGKLEFSNDGSLYKNLGSGSGSGDGGVSIIDNGSFEDGLTPGWQNTGGTFTQQTYTNGVEGDTKYARFVSTASGQYFETTLKAIPDFGVGGCLAKINYKTTDTSNWMLQVYDSSSNLIKEQALTDKNWQDGAVPFTCPTVGTQIRVRVASLGAGQIEADKAYLGKDNRLLQLSQANWLGGVTISDTNCVWTGSASGTSTNYTTDATCAAGTAFGSIALGTTGLPQFVIPANSPSGVYQINVNGFFQAETANQACSWRLSDGTNATDKWSAYNNTAAASSSGAMLRYSYSSSASPTTINIQYSGNGSCTVYISGSIGGSPLSFNVYQLTSAPQTALVPEAQDWFIDVNIFATGNLTLPNTTSYTELIATDVTMDVTEAKTTVQIPCSTTNPSTGTTCAVGSESLGVYVKIPEAGRYMICSEFATSMNNGQNVGLQWVETANASQTILQEGKSRAYAGHNIGVGGLNNAQQRCGIFRFNSAGFRTLRLMAEGSSTNSVIFLDRASSFGQPDLHVWMYQLSSAQNRPYLSGEQVTAPNIKNLKTCIASYGGSGSLLSPTNCTGSPCTEYYDSCGTASSTWSSTGATNTTFASGTWAPSAPISCSVAPENGSNGIIPTMGGTILTTPSGGYNFQLGTYIAGSVTNTNTRWTVTCSAQGAL